MSNFADRVEKLNPDEYVLISTEKLKGVLDALDEVDNAIMDAFVEGMGHEE